MGAGFGGRDSPRQVQRQTAERRHVLRRVSDPDHAPVLSGEPRSVAVFEGAGYVFSQLELILIHPQDIVLAPLDCLARYLLLAAHGVDGHYAALDFQRIERFGDGGCLVGMVVGLDLSERDADLSQPARLPSERHLARLRDAQARIAVRASLRPSQRVGAGV